MDKLIIEGPSQLGGMVEVSKAKNAYLPILTGALLCSGNVRFGKVPALRDVNTILRLLADLGAKVDKTSTHVDISGEQLSNHEATYDLVKTMRASILVLGPLLARLGKAKVSLPGGCAIGARPIDIHLENFEKMGAEISIDKGYVTATTNGLKGAELTLSFPSVGATENLMMGAALAKGRTVIENAAHEPEIVDLANFLNKMGGKVQGAGTPTVIIDGVSSLSGGEYEAIGDRIEAVTYIAAGLATNSHITVKGADPHHFSAVLSILEKMGAKLEISADSVTVFPSKLKGQSFTTAPYPGFPTDAQAQLMALMTLADGTSSVRENIFENRFMHVSELVRMGAKIELKGNTAVIEGPAELSGAPVMCTDLRASAALVVAALAAKGETEIQRVYHLDRGYEDIDGKLAKLGAKVRRIS